jgi:hypothetical protein
VSAGVTDARQTIVLGADRDVQRARTGARGERGRQVADPALDFEAGAVERLAEPSARLLFLEAEFGMGVDAMAEIDQLLAALFDLFACRVPRVHGILPF